MELLKFFISESVDKNMGEDGSERHAANAEQRTSEEEMPVTHRLPPFMSIA